MKVRIGLSLGPRATPQGLASTVGLLDGSAVDSVWVSEVVYTPLADPLIAMSYLLARTSRVKVGTAVTVLPGRHPVLVAKQLATLAGLAPGRVLPVFGLQPSEPPELAAFPVPGRRAAVFDESLELLRLLLSQSNVTYDGQFFQVEDASVGQLPAKPLDIWLGGSAPAGFRRVGRFGDGWLGALLTPAEAGAAREQIQEAAADVGREIPAGHFGISLVVGPRTPATVEGVRRRRPDIDPAALAPVNWDEARRMIEGYIQAGLTKFVVRPAIPATGDGVREYIDDFVAHVKPLED